MLADSRWMVDARRRRLVLLTLLAILGVLSIFPRNYRAAASLAPVNASNVGVTAVAGAVGGSYTSFLQNYLPAEVDLAVTRSIEVRRDVYRRLNLANRRGWGDEEHALRKLESKVEVRVLRANILEIAVKDHDPAFALALVSTTAGSAQNRLAALSLQQTAYKRGIIDNRINDAAERLTEAQRNYDNFRRTHRMADPGDELGLATERLKLLQKTINDKEVELATTRQFQTDQTMKVKTILGELATLRQQLGQVQSIAQPSNPQTVAGVVVQQTESTKLYRKLTFAQGLFDAYSRSLEGTAIEQLTADFNMRFLQSPFVDPDRQFNLLPLGLFLALLAIGLAVEFYLMRPPVGALRRLDPA